MFNRLIDKGVIKKRSEEKERDYLGASSMGEECSRKLQYQITQTPKDTDFTARTLRIFETGNMFEELAIKWILQAGFNLLTHDKNGNQFGFSQLNGKFKGHIDGKLIGKKHSRLWECKSMADKYFNKLVKEGLKTANFSYYIQIQIYMAYMDLTNRSALITVVNKNNCEIYNEWIAFDEEIAQKYSDRALNVIRDTEEFIQYEREYPSKTFYKCKMCPWRKTCWKED